MKNILVLIVTAIISLGITACNKTNKVNPSTTSHGHTHEVCPMSGATKACCGSCSSEAKPAACCGSCGSDAKPAAASEASSCASSCASTCSSMKKMEKMTKPAAVGKSDKKSCCPMSN